MAAKAQYVFPPDIGSVKAGTVPTTASCGRGIQRTGDIRHIGDLIPTGQIGVWTPGTIGQNVVSPKFDNDANPSMSHDRGQDIQCAPEAFSPAGKFNGLDASGEGFDPYSGKQGGSC